MTRYASPKAIRYTWWCRYIVAKGGSNFEYPYFVTSDNIYTVNQTLIFTRVLLRLILCYSFCVDACSIGL